MKNIIRILGISITFGIVSCGNFLDAKSDKSLTVPNRLSDMEALLNFANTMNNEYVVSLGEIASDNLYLTDNVWKAILAEEDRAPYIWESIPVKDKYWPVTYNRILNSNVVIQGINQIQEGSPFQRDHLKGAALFYRAVSFFDLLQIFSTAYDEELAKTAPGIVIRLTANIDEVLERSSQAQGMKQIEEDLLSAITLLSDQFPMYPTQASKAAAFGMLSRYYLMKRDFIKSLEFANRALNMKNVLLDYNQIVTGKYPFPRYNEEVLFFVTSDGSNILQESRARVHPDLYKMYADNDLRKQLYFTRNADGYFAFTGDYSRNTSSYKFNGLTSSEILLTQIECNIRLDNIQEALTGLYRFVDHRYNVRPNGIDKMDKNELLRFLLDERRKELVFRGLRWFDLRRLTKDESRVDEIVRNIQGINYSITSDEIKTFRFLIPQSVTEQAGIMP